MDINTAELHQLNETDFRKVARSLSDIIKWSENLVERTSDMQAFRIYKAARDGLEAMVFDQISRETLEKLKKGADVFMGYDVPEIVVAEIRAGRKINAIKEMRTITGLGLKEAKDWVEAYAADRNIGSSPW